jgi:5-methylcytosine-specific restriction endonuclease McrA
MSTYQGELCPKCNSTTRYLKGDRCAECKRRQARDWTRNNREKNRERSLKWRLDNPDQSLNNARQYREAHPEQTKEAVRKYREAHLDTLRKYLQEWQKANPHKVKQYHHKYRTSLTKAGGSFTAAEWKHLCQIYDNRCLACDKQKPLTADHVIPIAKGGTSDISNIQPLCQSCNSKKGVSTTDYRDDRAPRQLSLFD